MFCREFLDFQDLAMAGSRPSGTGSGMAGSRGAGESHGKCAVPESKAPGEGPGEGSILERNAAWRRANRRSGHRRKGGSAKQGRAHRSGDQRHERKSDKLLHCLHPKLQTRIHIYAETAGPSVTYVTPVGWPRAERAVSAPFIHVSPTMTAVG